MISYLKKSIVNGRVVSNFILQALRGEDITIFGDGMHTRSFCFVDDIVSGLIRLMEQAETVGSINLGNTDEHSIKEIAELIIKLTDSSSKLVYKPLLEDDPLRRKPDITMVEEKLNWTSTVTLEEGLPKVIEYFRPLSKKHSAPNNMPR